ncbi:MAG: DNA recombination protein RmuC [Alphaproteobacteria bacterium]
MDTATILVVVAAAFVGALVAVLLVGRLQRRPPAELAEVAGRVAQLTESQAAAHSQLQERLQAQERTLAKTLEERLESVSRQVGQGLEKSSTQTQATLGSLHERLAVMDAAQKNIMDLSSQMVTLQNILSNKQARGAFGEVQLRDLVMQVLPAKLYELQATVGDGKRVDCLLKLPKPPGPIAVDAKFPLESYRALRDAKDDTQRREAQRLFAAAIIKHVRDISEKYIVPGETAEVALMFLPSEVIVAELNDNFPEVLDQARRQRVVIVSPNTLWLTLNTLRAVLKDVQMREQASVIQNQVELMLNDVRLLEERTVNLERHFDQANKDIQLIRTSTKNITKRGERIGSVELDIEPAPTPVVRSEERTLLADEPATDRAADG